MSDTKVTKGRINQLMMTADEEISTVFGKCTVVTMKLENGFIMTESSACVDPANYDKKLGVALCKQHIENRLWELEGYALQKSLYERESSGKCSEETQSADDTMSGDFGWALDRMRRGFKVRRRGWNGKGIFIKLQVPDGNSKMTSPYIYIDTTGLQSTNPDAPRSCVPWLASQTDMLAEDWEIAAE